MQYRILQPDEWGKLHELDRATGALQGKIPHPAGSVAAVAEDENGVIVGVLFLQLQYHMEPLVISPKYRSKVWYNRLVETIEDQLKATGVPCDYYVFSPDKRIGRMCQIVGMEHTPYHVWRKCLEPEETDIEEPETVEVA